MPEGHGQATFRLDCAYYALELLAELRRQQARFTVSVLRNQAMWKALERIPGGDWQEALAMEGAEVAETSYTPEGWQHEPLRLLVRRVRFTRAQIASTTSRRRRTIHPEQLQLCLDSESDHCFDYSFILTDLPGDERCSGEVERFHRHRAQIEERLKEAKLGQALRHLPSGCEHANRVWLHNRVWLQAALLALCLAAMCCDLCPAAAASGKAPQGAPLRRAAKTLRRLPFCVPARIVRLGRRIILCLPAGFRYAAIFQSTYQAAYALRSPGLGRQRSQALPGRSARAACKRPRTARQSQPVVAHRPLHRPSRSTQPSNATPAVKKATARRLLTDLGLNPHKQGHFLPGTQIPIRSPERLREDKPDVVLILPWNLKDEIIEQLSFARVGRPVRRPDA